MKRRTLLKNIATGLGSLAVLPAWATTGWTTETLPKTSSFSFIENQTLEQLVELIIPKTDTPGAAELGVHNFVAAMVNDCVSAETKKNFFDVLSTFGSLSAEQRLQKLTEPQTKAEKDFFHTLKRFTIQGYMTSEYVMTNLQHFEFAPGRYAGCVDL
jgi:Gluconate 2-dehydrogenase subunit 3